MVADSGTGRRKNFMIPIGMLSQEKQTVFLFLLLLILFGEVILLVYKGSHLLPLRK